MGGFAEETENILSLISPERYLGFSATNSIEVDERLRAVLPRHEFSFLKTEETVDKELAFDVSPTVLHYKKRLNNEVNPPSIALEIKALRKKFSSPTGSTIVFCNKKREVDALAGSLRMVDNAPWSGVYQIHGEFPQNQRNKIMKAVRDNERCLLIGTALISRGIDLPNVDLVIHLGCANQSTKDYIHKSGRTGRAGNTGHSVVLFSSASDSEKLHRIEQEALLNFFTI